MNEPRDAVIETRGLRRVFKTRTGTVEAVAGVDLRVEAGEVFGFLGPNGAGKTTTLRMLATLLTPTGGDATVAGFDLHKEPQHVREQIGYVGQRGGSDAAVTGRDELVFQGRLYGMAKHESQLRAAELLRVLELEDCADRVSGTYSGGQRRRLDIGIGLMHGPKLLFLDEPTTGLDPQSRARLWDEVRGCATAAPPSSSPPTTSRRRTRSATGWRSSTTARSWPRLAGRAEATGCRGRRHRRCRRPPGGRHQAVPVPALRPRGGRRGGRDDPALRGPGRDGDAGDPPAARRRRPRAEDDHAHPAEPRRRVPEADRPLAPGGGGMKTLRDIWLVFLRYWGIFLRNPAWVAIGVLQPVLYLVLFAPLLKSIASVQGFPPGGAYNVFVPGLLDPAGHVRRRRRRLQPDRRAPGRGRRALPGDAGQPSGSAARPGVSGHPDAAHAGDDPDRPLAALRPQHPLHRRAGRPRPGRPARAPDGVDLLRLRALAEERGLLRAADLHRHPATPSPLGGAAAADPGARAGCARSRPPTPSPTRSTRPGRCSTTTSATSASRRAC